MGNVFTFTPLPSVAAPAEPAPMTEGEVRARLGEALQTAVDAADHIIAVLDRMAGDTDREDGRDAERSTHREDSRRGFVGQVAGRLSVDLC